MPYAMVDAQLECPRCHGLFWVTMSDPPTVTPHLPNHAVDGLPCTASDSPVKPKLIRRRGESKDA